MKREGSDVSKHLQDYITQYVLIHGPGNSQARITSYVDEETTILADVMALEGKIREFFRHRGENGIIINEKDIRQHCKAHISNSNKAVSMAGRVCEWLLERGIKVWA